MTFRITLHREGRHLDLEAKAYSIKQLTTDDDQRHAYKLTIDWFTEYFVGYHGMVPGTGPHHTEWFDTAFVFKEYGGHDDLKSHLERIGGHPERQFMRYGGGLRRWVW